MNLVNLQEIEQAAAELPAEVVRTPVVRWADRTTPATADVWLKLENLQVTGSYKARAAFTILNRLTPEQRERGAAISSSGNFAAAWAFMGALLGIPAAVVMQEKTSPFKVERTRRYGGEVVICENDFDARFRTLRELQEQRGMAAINTFEDADVIRGHGTLGLEIIQQIPDLEQVLIPVSSGGLIAGMATAIKELRPSVRVVGVQPEGAHAAADSFREGEVVRRPVDTLCDALIAAYPGALPFAHIQKYVDDFVIVPEEEVKYAIRSLVEHDKLVAEAGGAVAVAALRCGLVRADRCSAVLVSGGNILPATLAAYLLETEIPPQESAA